MLKFIHRELHHYDQAQISDHEDPPVSHGFSDINSFRELKTLTNIVSNGVSSINNIAPSSPGIWMWQQGNEWRHFTMDASHEIDQQLRHQWKTTSDTIIKFPLTKGPFFSQIPNTGIYFVIVEVNESRTDIVSMEQHNAETRNIRNIKREPPFILNDEIPSTESSKLSIPEEMLYDHGIIKSEQHKPTPESSTNRQTSTTSYQYSNVEYYLLYFHKN